jgi:hypothetical protein
MAIGDVVVGNLSAAATFTPAVGVVVLITQYGASSVNGGICGNVINYFIISSGGSNYFNGRIALFVSNSNTITQQNGNGSYSGIQVK